MGVRLDAPAVYGVVDEQMSASNAMKIQVFVTVCIETYCVRFATNRATINETCSREGERRNSNELEIIHRFARFQYLAQQRTHHSRETRSEYARIFCAQYVARHRQQ